MEWQTCAVLPDHKVSLLELGINYDQREAQKNEALELGAIVKKMYT